MKTFKYFLSLLLLILLIFANIPEVFAMNTGFSVTDSFTDEEKEHIVKNSNIKLLKEEPVKESIRCFDVNKDGLIAIGTKNISDMHYICIYNSDGIFQYGYSFVNSGSFGIEFDNENIIIYFVRGGIVVSVNPNGEILEIAEVDNTMENNTYNNYLIHPRQRVSGNKKYIPKKDMGIFNFIGVTYSQLAIIDSMGNEQIIYDVNSKLFAKTLMIFIGALLFSATVIITLTKYTIKNIKYNQEQQRIKAETQWNNSSIPPKDN